MEIREAHCEWSDILNNSICDFVVSISRRLKFLHVDGTCVICILIGKEHLKTFLYMGQSKIEECLLVRKLNQMLLRLQKIDFARGK